jgi:hypothetical protein
MEEVLTIETNNLTTTRRPLQIKTRLDEVHQIITGVPWLFSKTKMLLHAALLGILTSTKRVATSLRMSKIFELA